MLHEGSGWTPHFRVVSIGRDSRVCGYRLRLVKPETRARLLLFLFIVAIVGPFAHIYRAQQASRYAFTASVWENQTVVLDEMEDVVAIDIAVRDGHVYSDKAPLQPLLGVPFYGVYRIVGGEPATVLRVNENLGVWWQTFWFASVPLAALAVVLLAIAQRVDPKTAMPAVLAVVAGTILLPFGALLFGHVLGALFIALAVLLLLREPVTTRHLLGAGAMVGAAVTTEYPAFLAGAVVGVFALWRVRSRVIWFVVGGVPFAALLGIYHTIAFGSPLSHPYRYSAFSGVVTKERSFLEPFGSIRLDNLADIFFAGRGFLIATPVVILGMAGLIWMMRRRRGVERALAITSLGMFLAMLAVPLFWGNPWGGSSPGARYLTPALPLLAVGVTAAWSFRPIIARAVVTISVVTMTLATITDPLITGEGSGGFGRWFRLARDGEFADTVFTIGLGGWGWLVHLALVSGVGLLLYRSWQAETLAADGSMIARPESPT